MEAMIVVMAGLTVAAAALLHVVERLRKSSTSPLCPVRKSLYRAIVFVFGLGTCLLGMGLAFIMWDGRISGFAHAEDMAYGLLNALGFVLYGAWIIAIAVCGGDDDGPGPFDDGVEEFDETFLRSVLFGRHHLLDIRATPMRVAGALALLFLMVWIWLKVR